MSACTRFDSKGAKRTKQLRRAKTCVFGVCFQIPKLQTVSGNALMDSLLLVTRSPSLKAVEYVHKHLPAECPDFQASISSHCYALEAVGHESEQ